MNLTETALLAAGIEVLDLRVTFTPDRVRAWAGILGDVPFDLAKSAVIEHYRVSPYPILPADVRRLAAGQAGLLCPAEAVAWAYAVRVAQAGGEGRNALHPAVREAYDALGGARGPLRDGGSTARAQFRDTYRQVATEQDREVLAGAIPSMPTLPVAPAKSIENVGQ